MLLSARCDGVSVERSARREEKRREGRREPRNRHPSACGEEAAAAGLPAACLPLAGVSHGQSTLLITV